MRTNSTKSYFDKKRLYGEKLFELDWDVPKWISNLIELGLVWIVKNNQLDFLLGLICEMGLMHWHSHLWPRITGMGMGSIGLINYTSKSPKCISRSELFSCMKSDYAFSPNNRVFFAFWPQKKKKKKISICLH